MNSNLSNNRKILSSVSGAVASLLELSANICLTTLLEKTKKVSETFCPFILQESTEKNCEGNACHMCHAKLIFNTIVMYIIYIKNKKIVWVYRDRAYNFNGKIERLKIEKQVKRGQ